MKSLERKEFLFDVFTTALEGAIGYWAYSETYHWQNNGVADLDNFSSIVIDAEEEEAFERVAINQAVIAKGINLILNDENFEINDGLKSAILEANRKNDAGLIDGNCADCIVQAGLFGSIVFG